MVRKHSPIQIIGTVVCLLYAVIWVVAWFDPPPVLTMLFDPSSPRPRYRRVPPIWAALLFAAAPLMRRNTRTSQLFIAVGILAFIAPGLSGAAQARLLPAEALLWLVVPLAIAVWVFGPPLSDAERAALPPYRREPIDAGPALLMVFGVFLAVLAGYTPPGGLIVNLGFGDIVIPRYAALAVGLCCAALAFVLGLRSVRIRKSLYARAKPAIRVEASPQGGAFQWSVIIDGQTVGIGERATEREARAAADALIQRINPPDPNTVP